MDRADGSADAELLGHVRPANWSNPAPKGRYDLVVLGGGTAGLVAAMGAAGLGARVALVERDRLGGDCLNTGCVPSKALLRSARAVGDIRRAAELGVHTSPLSVSFESVMNRMRARRAHIGHHDSAERFRGAGIDVFFGAARFVDEASIDVDGARLRFSRAVIATGGRATVPPVPGLSDVPYLTNETIFDLESLPRRLTVVGAGPIGCELAQAFARFGSQVVVLDQVTQVLPREDRDAGEIVRRSLETDGVRFNLGVRLQHAVRVGSEIVVRVAPRDAPGASTDIAADAVLVAAGRAPNVEGLDLERAGVAFDKQGVTVNDRLQTTNRRVYASGDVCSAYKFTHAADALSRIVIQNSLFFGRKSVQSLVIPWVTYTDPEVAHVGMSSADVQASGGTLSTITVPLAEIDRAIVDDATDGFVRVHHERGRLRGCTIVAPHAGEMIAEAVFAMTHGGTVADFSTTVHPYPTYTEALRKAGDAYRREALTPSLRKWFERYFTWTR